MTTSKRKPQVNDGVYITFNRLVIKQQYLTGYIKLGLNLKWLLLQSVNVGNGYKSLPSC